MHMKKRIAWMLTLLLLLTAPFGLSALAEDQDADAFFARLFNKADPVGGAVLISRDGERLFEAYYGVEDGKTKVAVTENTVYKVASVSKMISAMGVMRLFDLGLIDLDAPMPGICNPHFPDIPVTLRQVMTHTSSLLGSAPYTTPPDWSRIDGTDKDFFSKYIPGTHYEYSNLNGGILCSVIERVSGQSFNTFMRENIFAPLGINAAYAAHLLPDASRLATTCYTDKTAYRRGPQYVEVDQAEYDDTCNPDAHYRTSLGSLYVSLNGLEKLGQVLAGDGTADDTRVLSNYAVRLMRLDQSSLPDSSVIGFTPYGLCMSRFTDQNGVTWYGHQGHWVGLYADLFFEPNTRTVVVFVLDGVQEGNNGQDINPRAEDALEYAGRWVQEAADSDSYVVAED